VVPLSKKDKDLPVFKSDFHLRVIYTEIHVLMSRYFGVALILCWIILLVVHDFHVLVDKRMMLILTSLYSNEWSPAKLDINRDAIIQDYTVQ
jgi:hypothetical protein